MSTLLKDLYTPTFFKALTQVFEATIPAFDTAVFLEDSYTVEWESYELKQRTRHITISLRKHLADDFRESADQLLSVVAYIQQQPTEHRLLLLFLPDYIEVYGLDHYDISVAAFEHITQLISCEFAVRPFIIRYTEQMIAQMLEWSKHSHEAVRRLATEGARPRLPWGMALPALKKDPALLMPILETLKADESETVRRSVANNLNDISKDNPEVVIALVKAWQGQSKEVDWVVKHACRTLLKQGDAEVMQLFGFGTAEDIKVEDFEVHTPTVRIGEHLAFSFDLLNVAKQEELVRLEYGIYYMKANGTLSRKVFKISEKGYAAASRTRINRKQSFKVITTRRYHTGLHKVSLIINGKEVAALDFEVTI